jgi:glycosyltransferase involved in cell wall biosynthesis
MKISVICHDLSGNNLVRAYPIVKVLEKHYEVEVLGVVFGDGIFPPYRNEFNYKCVTLSESGGKFSLNKTVRFPGFFGVLKKLMGMIEGDVVYAYKPMLSSLGVGIMAKYVRGLPLVLDIEDWDARPFLDLSHKEKISALRWIQYPSNDWFPILMEPLVNVADYITVASSFLQRKFGGIRLPHGADCSFFDPAKYDRNEIRRKLGIEGKKIILFAGTPRLHKGMEELLSAIRLIDSDSIKLMVVGFDTEYWRILQKQIRSDSVISIGPRPHSEMPQILSCSDLVVIPQRQTRYSEAQIPAKVFEAMAMAKPIIATSVSDLPEILEGCGWIVPPERPGELAGMITEVFDHPLLAGKNGLLARKKCIDHYSWEAMETKLTKMLDTLGKKCRS